jgi:hypothetical protein
MRQQVVNLRSSAKNHFVWYEAVAAAIFHSQVGERIISIAEADENLVDNPGPV